MKITNLFRDDAEMYQYGGKEIDRFSGLDLLMHE